MEPEPEPEPDLELEDFMSVPNKIKWLSVKLNCYFWCSGCHSNNRSSSGNNERAAATAPATAPTMMSKMPMLHQIKAPICSHT